VNFINDDLSDGKIAASGATDRRWLNIKSKISLAEISTKQKEQMGYSLLKGPRYKLHYICFGCRKNFKQSNPKDVAERKGGICDQRASG
jgi:hypothetical protein